MGRSAPFALSYMFGRNGKRLNNRTSLPTLQNNTTAGWGQGPVKIELLKGEGLLNFFTKLGHFFLTLPSIYKPVSWLFEVKQRLNIIAPEGSYKETARNFGEPTAARKFDK